MLTWPESVKRAVRRMSTGGFEETLRNRAYRYAHVLEAVLNVTLAFLLAIGAGAALIGACGSLWHGLWRGSASYEASLVIDRLLLVLIFVEILHTVRIAIRTESLVMEPFLIVGIIASVRRVLVITVEATQFAQAGLPGQASHQFFWNSMIELGLLGFLILVLAFSLFLLRRTPPRLEERLAK
jgi:uncharacterized membrane protein (DUF373 family)